MSRILNKSNE
ncbi:hypothetical protein D039_2023A, partial [Vibrio parahaemolyticus EKP-028]